MSRVLRSPVCGIETEYGLLSGDPSALSQSAAALSLLDLSPGLARFPWDLAGESPGRDARDGRDVEVAPVRLGPHDAAGFLLANGARFYVDHGHPEYATPECLDPRQVLASDRAGELLLEACMQILNRTLPPSQRVRLFKNNSDFQGHSYGCHESYCLSTRLHRSLFLDDQAPLHRHLIPFWVSRLVVCGAGKVGSENGQPAVDFQISSRADFFETLLGPQTMSRRPVVNTRDEPHADRDRFRRLHVILGDSNLAQTSTYLKVGTTQLMLAMLEAGAELPDLRLYDPVRSLVRFSHDPTCRSRARLADGRRRTAIEIQLELAEAAQRFVDRGAKSFSEVVARWTRVLEQLRNDPRNLGGTLDWVIKWNLLDEWRQRKDLPWNAAVLRELDIRYHDIDRSRGLFFLIEAQGRVETMVEETLIERALREPIAPTRAVERSRRLEAEPGRVATASWSTIRWRGGELSRFEEPAAGLDR